jgi:DNA polymerase (family 10)
MNSVKRAMLGLLRHDAPRLHPTRTSSRLRSTSGAHVVAFRGTIGGLKSFRIPLGRAHLLASMVMREARRAGLAIEDLMPLGSLRRYAPDVGDVSLLAVAPAQWHGDVLEGFTHLPIVTSVEALMPTSVEIATDRGRVRLHLTTSDDAGASLVWHTGAQRHTLALQAHAARRGLTFRDGLLSRANGVLVATPDEDELYRQIGLPFIAPELREGTGEVEAAERGRLPTLVTAGHIRGDLHMHSTWSDGRDSIQHMVVAAKQIGYEYVAITDHSERAFASRKLLALEVPIQREEIEELRARVTGIEILHGVEVDIMGDGSLDFDDELLQEFDIVLASLHDDQGQDGDELTERYLKAMQHPLVNIITHPANRSPAMSPGYDVDFDRVFAAAVDTGTALEIDGAPGHLDMDGTLARRAVAAGVTVVIDSDCHRSDALARQMQFGIGTARRGWVEPGHVLNTHGLDTVRAFIAKKRARRR